MGWVRIGDIGFNIAEVEKLTEKQFIESYGPHYRHIRKNRVDKIRSDYKELKKNFKVKKKEPKSEE